MKSKRLKNFCEVCRKQCKDQNGYHCHLNSGHHQKRLRELATNPQEHIQKYSTQLQNRIIQILKTKYPGEPKDIEDIYQQYAQEKHYVKFNFTRWKDLSQFVQYLRNNVKNLKVVGKLPYCNITYLVNKAGDFLKKKKQQQMYNKKQRQKQLSQKKLEERIARMRQVQGQKYKQMKQKIQKQQDNQEYFDLDKQQFRFDFAEKTYQPSKLFMGLQQNHQKDNNEQGLTKPKLKNVQKLLQQIQKKENNKVVKKQNQTKKQQKQQQQQFEWIMPGIVVKVLPHQIPQVFHGKKAEILKISEPFIAQIKLGNATLNIDQIYLETIIPKINNEIKILKGTHRGSNGILKQVDIQNGIGRIEINGVIIEALFNQFSKIS